MTSAGADFGRTWLYRASLHGDVIAEAVFGDNDDAATWAITQVLPGVADSVGTDLLVLDRQDASGGWTRIGGFGRATSA